MTGEWKTAGEKPQIGAGTQILVRMKGSKLGESAVEEVDGFYLNEFGLGFDDGCQCFGEGENLVEKDYHDNHGCPHSGFFYIDEDGEEAPYLPFRCVEWCKR